MNIMDRLNALSAAPKPWLVTMTYASGHVRMLRQPKEVMARNFAERESRKIGRDLINRETGEIVRMVRVDVDYMPETLVEAMG